MAAVGQEDGACVYPNHASAMRYDTLQPPTKTGETMSPTWGGEAVYPPSGAWKGDDDGGYVTDTQGGTDSTSLSSPAAPIGDITYGSPCPCFLYGGCPMMPMSNGWDGVESKEGKVEKGVEEGGHMPDYICQYPPSRYLSFPPPPVPLTIPNSMPVTRAVPAVTPSRSSLIVLSPSSPTSSTASPPTKISKKKDEGPDSPNSQPNGLEKYPEVNDHFNLGAPPPTPAPPTHSTVPPAGVAVPYPLGHGPAGTPPHLFTEESKMGVFGADGCWYSLANMQNMNGPDHHNHHHQLHAGPLTSPLHKASICFPYFNPSPTTLISPLTHPYQDPTLYIPPTNSECLATSPPSASSFSTYPMSPFSHNSSPNGKCEAEPDGQLYYNYYQHLNVPTDVFGKPHLLSTVKKEGKMSLEDLWLNHMRFLFKHLPDEWVLAPAKSDRKMSSHWYSFRDLAKVRFYCNICNDGWTSMYGVVVFHYRWNRRSLQGQILYKVARQKCGGICKSTTFELPLWYPEEAQKVITNLYYKIAGQYYNLVTPQYIRTRRFGRPTTHHNRSLCEGCCQGICKVDAAAADVQQ